MSCSVTLPVFLASCGKFLNSRISLFYGYFLTAFASVSAIVFYI